MIVVTPGVVLSRKPWGENDRLSVVYTQALGKTPVRFIGVDKPKGKLKAFSEPMVHAEFRLYAKPGREWATAAGGRLIDSYPGLREDFEKTVAGLRLCELLLRLTSERSPSERKYSLIVESLAGLESAPAGSSGWRALSFGFRLLEAGGFGLGHLKVRPAEQEAWRRLHSDEPSGLAGLEEAGSYGYFEGILERAVENHLGFPLKTKMFQEELESA